MFLTGLIKFVFLISGGCAAVGSFRARSTSESYRGAPSGQPQWSQIVIRINYKDINQITRDLILDFEI